MGKLIDLTGKAFGRLRVLERDGQYRSPNSPESMDTVWRCLCDPELGGCGNISWVLGSNLRAGKVRSCGCLRADMMRERAKARKTRQEHETV